jgi:hypothetical protein
MQSMQKAQKSALSCPVACSIGEITCGGCHSGGRSEPTPRRA